jgi:hypothetical protein
LYRAANLIRERTHHQWMSRINIIMMDHRIGMLSPRFPEHPTKLLALTQAEIQRRRDNESLGARFNLQIFDSRKPHIRIESQNARASLTDTFELHRRRGKIAGDYESRHTAPITPAFHQSGRASPSSPAHPPWREQLPAR